METVFLVFPTVSVAQECVFSAMMSFLTKDREKIYVDSSVD